MSAAIDEPIQVSDRRRLPIMVDRGIVEDGRLAKMRGPAVSVYLALLSFGGAGNDEVWPSRRKLAELTGYSTDTVDSGLAVLVGMGAVSVAPQYRDNRGQTSNRYILNPLGVGAPPPRSLSGPPLGVGAAPPLGVGAAPGTSTSTEQIPVNLNPPGANAAPEPSKPKRTRKEAAPPEFPAEVLEPIRMALYRWMGLGDGSGASRHVHVQVMDLAKLYARAGEGAPAVEAERASWYRDDWRGRQGEHPTTVAAMQDHRARRRNGGAAQVSTRPGAHDPAQKVTYASPEAVAAAKAEVARMQAERLGAR